MTHIDHYQSQTGQQGDYIVYDERSGEITHSDEFLQHLSIWEDLFADTFDPLVAEGSVEWTSMTEIGQLFGDWEVACGQ